MTSEAEKQDLLAEIRRLEGDRDGWMNRYLEQVVKLRACRAALNGDLFPNLDEETLARKLYHENVDLRMAAEGWKKIAMDLREKSGGP